MRFLHKTLAGVTAIAMTALGLGSVASAETTPEPAASVAGGTELNTSEGARGSIAVLPDTQFYARYGETQNNQYGKNFPDLPNPYDSQVQWIIDHSKDYHIGITQHLGDVVDQMQVPGQWALASASQKKLEDAGVPYAILPGNHDCHDCVPEWNGSPDDLFGTYKKNFPVSRQAKSSTFQKASPSGLSNFHLFKVAGVQMASVNLPWHGDDAEIAWAGKILDQNPTIPTIVTSHQIINVDGEGNPLATDYGDKLWDKIIRNHPQVFLTLNGHHHGATNRVLKNDAGLDVFEQLIDFQGAYQGGNGKMSLLEFDFTHNQLSQTSFSPWVMQKSQKQVTPFDKAIDTSKGATFSYPIDFKKRFEAFGATYKPEGSVASSTADLRAWIERGFTPAEAIEKPAPKGEADYPQVRGTLAHWRPVKEKGLALKDLTGNGNDMALTGPADAASLSEDVPQDSAAAKSVYFTPQGKGVFARFQTKDDAPLNGQEFKKGYTFETFVKIDKNFSEANHWMAFVTRGGKRSDIKNFREDSDIEEPPLAGAISSLREVQWAFADAEKTSLGHSNWSSEIPVGKWHHIAVVDDPAADSVTMFVDGAPTLRATYGVHGLRSINNLPWIIGGSLYNGEPNTGFFGNIGETRIVDHPLKRAEWLTARTGQQGPAQPGTEQPGKGNQPTATGQTKQNTGAQKPAQPSTHKGAASSKLSHTGVNMPLVLGAVVVLVLAGGAVLYLRRRRG
ncbi:hypothetical protein HMPREF2851_02380 [Actinomyces sp. HMSC064C12]|nr:hypothetical protein HMPREF2851_02380 [Actinomyces sp. HMSC064C12]